MYLKLFHRPQHNSVSSAKQEGTTQSGGNILWHGNELDSNEQCPTSSSWLPIGTIKQMLWLLLSVIAYSLLFCLNIPRDGILPFPAVQCNKKFPLLESRTSLTNACRMTDKPIRLPTFHQLFFNYKFSIILGSNIQHNNVNSVNVSLSAQTLKRPRDTGQVIR